jgi:WhiB family redox-sensing transcriptional regulator
VITVLKGRSAGRQEQGIEQMWNLLNDQSDHWHGDEEFVADDELVEDGEAEGIAPILPLFGDLDSNAMHGWQDRALCSQTDPEAFFPEKGGSTRDAKKVCVGCEVKAQCLEYALRNDERFGIWGGLSERERRKLKKRAV